jgi:hypothetical protein
MRDFVVLIRETKYDVSTDKFLTNIRNINVLIGKESDVDTVKKEVEAFTKSIGATYRSEWRVQKV